MISSKLLDYMMVGRPVIFSTNVKNHLVKKSGVGIVVPPKSPLSLADAIMKIEAMSQKKRLAMGEKGIKYLIENHDVELLANRLDGLL